jgi:hypothetical protein
MRSRIPALIFAVMLSSGAALVQGAAPTVESAKSQATYVTGGIGVEDRAQLKAREKEFNLKLVFTSAEGNYLSDVDVAVKDATDKSALALVAPGPLVLAKLPRGSYVVQATYEGKRQTRTVKLSDSLNTVFLKW